MTIPNLSNPFGPTIAAIEDVVLHGSGSGAYVVPTGSFSMSYAYSDRTQEGLAQDTLWNKQLNVKVNQFKDSNAWLQPSKTRMYDIEVGIKVSRHLDSKILKIKRDEVETGILADCMQVQNAIQYVHNLTSGSGGYTGLVSGRLAFDRTTNVNYDYSNSVASAMVLFTGKIVVSNSYG